MPRRLNACRPLGRSRLGLLCLGLVCLFMAACGRPYDKHVQDEAAWVREHVETAENKVLPRSESGTLFPTHSGDAYQGMDSHIESTYRHPFSKDEIEGRNTWVMWTGGNQEFWDYVSRRSNGIVDLLKLCDSRFMRREDRFRIAGIIPHPGMKEIAPKAPLGKPSADNAWGLHLDTYGKGTYVEGGQPDPQVYGYASGIAGLRLFPRATDPDPRVRKEWKESQEKWDPDRYITDESYFKDPELIRPFRVGMSCGFCHISANPMNPPTQMHKAQWSNLSSNIGSQYFWFGRVFGTDFKRDNLLYYLLNYAEPGTLDTSLVATDGNNNPNTMNSVYQVLPRIAASLNSPAEETPDGPLEFMPRLDQGYLFPEEGFTGRIVDAVPNGPNDVKPVLWKRDPNVDSTKQRDELMFMRYLGLGEESDRLPALGKGNKRHTPKVLAGGADSIGGRGALCRVYLNIGEFSEEWRQLHYTMIGGVPQKSFKMKNAAERSLNWHVTMRRSTNVAKYLIACSAPMRLDQVAGIDNVPHPKTLTPAPASDNYPGSAGGKTPSAAADKPAKVNKADYQTYVLPNHHKDVLRGAKVFAENCFVCHSSLLQPDEFWKDPSDWKRWASDKEYISKTAQRLVDILNKPVNSASADGDPFFEEFVKSNYLSTDARYDVTDIGTNVSRSLGDNGREGRMWEDFSSVDFKNQPKVKGNLKLVHPYDEKKTYTWPINSEAGPGRYRAPSLSSMWAHGPYLHNNSVGFYPYEYVPDPRPSQEGQSLGVFAPGIQSLPVRLKIFEDSSRRLLGLKYDAAAETDLDWRRHYYNASYRGFSEEPRRGYDSIVRFQDDAHLELHRILVPDLVYMTTLNFLGVGIPRWVLTILVVLLLVLAILLFLKGTQRLRQSRGSGLRNFAVIAIGLLLIGQVFVLWQTETYRIGHIPKGTPVDLVASINGPAWVQSSPKRKKLLALALVGLKRAEKDKVTSLEEVEVGHRNLVDILLALSKCPDAELDRGHEFGIYKTAGLAEGKRDPVSVEDREALIEFLKKL